MKESKSNLQKKEAPTDGEFLSGFWKTDRLIPVITLVTYFGSNSWDAPLSLKEMYYITDSIIKDLRGSLAETIKRIAERFQLSEIESSEKVKQYW
ncbi:MAG: hypothetical protein K2O34_09505 [Acetatifactor sp.]|nr:hypothetical protein [Acetatifactor sp.]